MMGSPVIKIFKHQTAAVKILKDFKEIMQASILYHVNTYVSILANHYVSKKIY